MAKVACMVVMSMVVVAAMMAGHAQSLSCGTVASDLSPCLNYVRNGGVVPVGCCDGIKSLYRSAGTTADRQAVCNCMKTAAGSVPGVNMDLAAGLPNKCGVSLNYKISPSIDCAKVK